jgi:hypothetical protein
MSFSPSLHPDMALKALELQVDIETEFLSDIPAFDFQSHLIILVALLMKLHF